MSKTTKPVTKPTGSRSDLETDLGLGTVSNARQEFFSAAINMSWQLAIVVLVPVIGGFKLDEHFNSLPLWTIVGFVVAMIGMAVVVWGQLQRLNPKLDQSSTLKKTKEHHS